MTLPELKANEILKRLRIDAPNDLLLLDDIAWELGALVVDEPMDGADARIIMAPDRATIAINAAVTPARRRFSIAHELGHWVLHRSVTAAICTPADIGWFSSRRSESRERDADSFATCLLLPRRFCEPCFDATPSFDLFDDLAERFAVSLTALVYRYAELTPEPCAVLSYSGGQVRSCFRNRGFQDLDVWIETPSSLDPTTVAATCIAAAHRGRADGETPVSAWARGDYRADSFVQELVWPMPAYNRVLILLWLQEEPEPDDNDDLPRFR